MAALLLLVAVAAMACGAGSACLGRILKWQSPCEQVVYSTAAGLGILAYAILAVGLSGLLSRPALLILLAAMAAVGLRPLLRLTKAACASLARQAGSRLTLVDGAAAAFLLGIGLFSLAGALAPPSTNDWDGLSYHLAVPKIYLGAGRIHYLPWMSHSNFPFTWEMLYTLGLALNGPALAKLFHWLAGALTAGAAYVVARQMWGRRAGLLAACAFLAAPLVGWEATVASNDLAAGLYTLLALGSLLAWKNRGEGGWLAAAGCFAGFAAGCKMTALLLIAFLAVSALIFAGAGRGIRSAALAAVIGAAIASPWYIKSALWTGNPVYPFFYEVFDGKYWSAEAAREYRQEQVSFGMGRGPSALAAFPWNLTMHANRFSNWPDRPFTLLTQSLGPLFLATLPLLWLRRLRWEERLLLGYCAVYFLAWFFLSQHVRYALPALGVLAVLAGGGASAACDAALGKLIAAAYAAQGAAALAIVAVISFAQTPAAMELAPAAAEINALPADSKVIMYGETRGFYFDRDYMWGNHHHEMLRYPAMRDAHELMRAYRELGVTHVLMTEGFYTSVERDPTPLAALLRQGLSEGLLRMVAHPRGFRLYAIERVD